MTPGEAYPVIERLWNEATDNVRWISALKAKGDPARMPTESQLNRAVEKLDALACALDVLRKANP